MIALARWVHLIEGVFFRSRINLGSKIILAQRLSTLDLCSRQRILP